MSRSILADMIGQMICGDQRGDGGELARAYQTGDAEEARRRVPDTGIPGDWSVRDREVQLEARAYSPWSNFVGSIKPFG